MAQKVKVRALQSVRVPGGYARAKKGAEFQVTEQQARDLVQADQVELVKTSAPAEKATPAPDKK